MIFFVHNYCWIILFPLGNGLRICAGFEADFRVDKIRGIFHQVLYVRIFIYTCNKLIYLGGLWGNFWLQLNSFSFGSDNNGKIACEFGISSEI